MGFIDETFFKIILDPILLGGTRWHGWLRHWATRAPVRFPMESLEFFIDVILSVTYGPGIDSVSNRNEFPDGKGGWRMGLTTLSPSCADCHEMWEPQPPGTIWV